jgi:hypothetical protein
MLMSPQRIGERLPYWAAGLVLDDGVEVLQVFHPIDEQDPIQMVELVVHEHGIESLENAFEGLSLLVQSPYYQVVGTGGLGVQSGEAEAAIEIPTLFTGLLNFGVDQGNGRSSFRLRAPASAQADHHHAAVNVYLRRRETDPFGVLQQGVLQIANQAACAPIHLAHRVAPGTQYLRVFPIQDNLAHGHALGSIL